MTQALLLLTLFQPAPPSLKPFHCSHPPPLLLTPQILRRLVTTPDMREALLKADGAELLTSLLRDASDGAVLTAVAALAEAASIKEEDNKCRWGWWWRGWMLIVVVAVGTLAVVGRSSLLPGEGWLVTRGPTSVAA